MSNDFSLERSRWYSLMMLANNCKYAKTAAEQITKWAGNLCNFGYDAVAGAKLAEAEDALTEALLAVQVARASYERVTNERAATKVAAE